MVGDADVVTDVDTGVIEDDEVLARLSVALGRLTRTLRRGDESGLGPGSISALATLVRSGPMRLGDLAAREGVAPPTLTRIVALLEECGYVERSPDPADRRASLVSATGAGEAVLSGVGGARRSKLAQRLAGLPAAERQRLLAAVRALELLADDDA
ncbi:MarR family winged helix-turn-helix transcriptional regulator [Spongisporangium articulatum]|uniref:MarR family winged helix-turn-helix transcriptional regulator n=1 Tax=Spongisporangium articulatum TaxID=3362603 RepID=A0ABW8AKG3_9ACTN